MLFPKAKVPPLYLIFNAIPNPSSLELNLTALAMSQLSP